MFGVDSTDAQLIAAIALRSEDAYSEVFRRHSSSVAAAARMILGRGSESEDVVAEVFVAFWLSPATFDPNRSSLLGFLRMKAKGRSIDVLRTLTARRRREDRDAFERRAQMTPMEAGVMAAESSELVQAAISSLPPMEEEALRLAFFSELTYFAVAQQLGIPEGTAKSRIRAGLHRLAENADIQAHVQTQSEVPDGSSPSMAHGSAE